MIRTAKKVNGKIVWDPPYTESELKHKRSLFDDMVQSKIPPGYAGQIDRRYLSGKVLDHGIGHLPSFMQQEAIYKARKAGIDITGKIYVSGLADGRGAGCPDAWVGGVDDVKAACVRLGKSCEGLVNYSAPEKPPAPDVELAEPIVREFAQKYAEEDPKLARDPVQLREMVIEKHGAPAQRRATPKFRCRQDIDRIPEPDSAD